MSPKEKPCSDPPSLPTHLTQPSAHFPPRGYIRRLLPREYHPRQLSRNSEVLHEPLGVALATPVVVAADVGCQYWFSESWIESSTLLLLQLLLLVSTVTAAVVVFVVVFVVAVAIVAAVVAFVLAVLD
ncbi:14054_t:CDS:2, partial [Funneliformis mosseae]